MASAAVLSVWPLRGDHKAPPPSPSTAPASAATTPRRRAAAGTTTSATSRQRVASNTSFPERTSTVIGGDGVPDVETPVDSISTVSGGQQLVCSPTPPFRLRTPTTCSRLRRRGLVHQPRSSTRAPTSSSADPAALQLEAVLPRGGPVAGGRRSSSPAPATAAAGSAAASAARRSTRRTRAPRAAVAAPPAAEAGAVELAVTSDGGDEWTRPLRFTYYETAPPALSSVWPIGPAAGGTHITVRGAASPTTRAPPILGAGGASPSSAPRCRRAPRRS